MAKEAHPQLEVRGNAPGIVHAGAGALPKRAPPERGLLLDVAVGSFEEAFAGPARNGAHSHSHALLAEEHRAAGNPLDLREVAEDAADHGEAANLVLVGGADPAHDFAGGAGEAFIERVVHAFVGLADPRGDLRFVFTNHVEGAVGGGAVDDEVFEVGIVLEDGLDGLLDVFDGVEDRGDEGDARPRNAWCGCAAPRLIRSVAGGLQSFANWGDSNSPVEQIKPIEVVIVKFLVEDNVELSRR